ncbi:MAG TPA: CheR family methyltransferase [Stellaceae bacterium]|jgi:chemotaxis protein methyltransferase CheR|nr:CheR family methyltransferase [Stellaceae bacterium]
MEETLRELEEAMAAHRRALAESSARQQVQSSAVKRDVAAIDERQAALQRLAADIERVSGIEITGMMEAKLGRVLASVNLAALDAWVSQLHLLPPDHPEWLSLIETLTVHETFFHRDRAQLELLAAILPEIIARAARPGRWCLRLWSAGCATGEEAYTLAILALLALRDAGFAEETLDGGIVCRPPWQLEVLGTDISRLVLTQAQAAVYSTEGLSAFRDLPRPLQRFFPLLPRGGDMSDAEVRGVHPAVRKHVTFGHFNLMAGVPPQTRFDVVLCRNVLIYLTAAARVAAQTVLTQALRPGGYLLLGPTDALAEPAVYKTRWGTGALAYALKRRHA